MPVNKLAIFATLLLILFSTRDVSARDTVHVVDEWLIAGPARYHSPAYSDVPGMDGEAWSVRQLLASDLHKYSAWQPVEGGTIDWTRDRSLQWKHVLTEDGTAVVLPAGDTDRHSVYWASVNICADRWLKADLTLESRAMLRVFLNGEEIASKTSPEDDESSPGALSHSLKLSKGTHQLLVKVVIPARSGMASATLEASLDAGAHSGALSHSITPERTLALRDLSNSPRPAGISVSPDGELASVHIRRSLPPDGTTESWIDIRRVSDGSIYKRLAGGMSVTGMQWVPDGRRFSYTESGRNGTTLWMVDLETGEKSALLKGVDNFAGYQWAPDASMVIYSVTEEYDPRVDGVLRYHGLQDRRPGYHDRTYLHQLNVPEGTTRRLTAGRLSTTLGDIHPDGTSILFQRYHEVYDERPYGKTEHVLLNLRSMETETLFKRPFTGAGRFSPFGDQILFTGGPGSFGEAGINIPDTLVANEYDTQAYLYDMADGTITSITRDFDPNIIDAAWDDSGRYLYLVVGEASFRNLYRYDTTRGEFRKYGGGPDVIQSFSLARNKAVAAFTGSGASDPPKAWTIDLTRRNPVASVLYDPGADAYRHIRFGDIRPWTFTNRFGEEIDGHVYYPPDFDASETYPVIVYYYGGTSPVDRAFGGRYPKELYASKGYLVYVLQPSGATGFGQEFSARHVNDWGEIAGQEIIAGVGDFLDAHEYADRERVGAIGASYGGFMTMYLLTQTDLFAAAVSHAGISNLASYWGEGFWGYQYSGVATADSYPWNRQDIYVERSPVFLADQIHTPLMLVTGMSDTNVPPGESLQMFTALKLLGREVAFVAIEEQDHHILDYKKYIHWKSAILAWFDKWLKEESEWWEVEINR
ncbi:S9 family peptidase [Balneolales bacterium ANBcel1]|nr:S9 family peptidase [Balneolales bacterium ANBcel1]